MGLNRYGILFQQYLQENEPEEYKNLEEKDTLMERLEKKQNEILEYRNKLYEDIKNGNIIHVSDFTNEMDYELAVKEYVENEVNKKLADFFKSTL